MTVIPPFRRLESPARAVARVLGTFARDEPGAGLEGYQRGYGESATLAPALARMWSSYEERIVATLVTTGSRCRRRRGSSPCKLVAIMRVTTAPETACELRGLDAAAARVRLVEIIEDAASHVVDAA